MLDKALVALGGEEGVCDGGGRAECLRGRRVDLARDALVAEGAGGGFAFGGRNGSLRFGQMRFLRRFGMFELKLP